MNKHEGGKRAYIRNSKAFYSKFLNEDVSVMVGIYSPNGGTSGEFEFVFDNRFGKNLVPMLKAYDDSWSALWEFKDLLEKMAELDDQEIQEPEFCQLLDSLGIVDITRYEPDVVK